MRLLFLSLPIALGLSCGTTQAQNAPPPLTKPRPSESQGATLSRIQRLYRYGLNREVVDTATLALNRNRSNPSPNLLYGPSLLYWRGVASRRIYLLDGAQRDLQQLEEFTPDHTLPPASQVLTKVNELLKERPPLKAVVRSSDGKTVLFRVYSLDDDEFLQSVITNLSLGYEAASAFTCLKTNEVPIFVFNTARYPEFVKFRTGFMGSKQQLAWERTVTQSGTITFSQRSRSNPLGRPSNDPRLLQTATHEITHQLIRALVGSSMGMPTWFSEGIAQFGEGIGYPILYVQNDALLQTLVSQEAILPLTQIEASKDFDDSVTKQKAGEHKGSPYAQGLSMTRYLVTRLQDENVPGFLQSIRKKLSFDVALKDATGFNKEGFYSAWKNTLLPPAENINTPLP